MAKLKTLEHLRAEKERAETQLAQEQHTHRKGRVQPLDQGNQCRYPGH